MKIIRTTKAAVDIISRGGVVAMPTDTVYGLIAIANPLTRKKIIAIKQSSKNKKVLLFVDGLAAAERIAHISPRQKKFLSRVWPGPVTVVLKNRGTLPGFSEDTLALRVPKNRRLLSILTHIAMPLTATSANVSGNSTPVTAPAVFREFKFSQEKPDAVFLSTKESRSPKRIRPRAPSTIVAFRSSRIVILRDGAIASKALAHAWSASGVGRKK